jgi:hypothetical protein
MRVTAGNPASMSAAMISWVFSGLTMDLIIIFMGLIFLFV